MEDVLIPYVQPLNLPVPSQIPPDNISQHDKTQFLQMMGLKFITKDEKLGN